MQLTRLSWTAVWPASSWSHSYFFKISEKIRHVYECEEKPATLTGLNLVGNHFTYLLLYVAIYVQYRSI